MRKQTRWGKIRRRASDINGFGWFGWVFALVAILIIVANLWMYMAPLDQSLEMRCRMGDSVACLSLPRNR